MGSSFDRAAVSIPAFNCVVDPHGVRLVTEQKDQPFRRCRVSENRIAQHRKRHSPDHRGLDGGHKFARLDTKRGECQDLVAPRANLPTWPTLGRRHTKVPPRVV